MQTLKAIEGLELKALIYAEKWGIVEYTVQHGEMTWTTYYPNEGRFLHTLDLQTGEEITLQIEKPYWQVEFEEKENRKALWKKLQKAHKLSPNEREIVTNKYKESIQGGCA